MGRAPCCDKANVKKGPWSPEEDAKLKSYIEENGTGGNWIALPQKIGLKRCGKSCRLRWLNYLRPDIRHGGFTEEEENIICNLYINIGSRWSIIAAQLPGRTDNDIKNYWNTRLKKKLIAKQRKEQAANRAAGLLDQEIKRGNQHHHHDHHHNHEMFLINQTLNHHQQIPYWADPAQLSIPMIHPNNNPDDPLTRLLMKIGTQFTENDLQFIPSHHQNNHNHQFPDQMCLNSTQWTGTGTGFEHNDEEALNNTNSQQSEPSGNFSIEMEAYLNNLLRFDTGDHVQTYSNNVDNVGNNTNAAAAAAAAATTTTTNSGGSSSWGDMNNSLVNTPVSDFDAYQSGVLQAM